MLPLQRTFESETTEQGKRKLKRGRQATYRKRQKTSQDSTTKCYELGRMDQICIHCGAKFWMDEDNFI